MVKGGLQMLMQNQSIKVIGRTGTGLEILLQAELLNSDTIFINLSKEDLNQLSTLKIISDDIPDKNIIILSPDTDDDFDASKLKASRIIMQEDGTEQQRPLLKELLNNKKLLTEKIRCNAIHGCTCIANPNPKLTIKKPTNDLLTKREVEILYEVKSGLTNREIAERLEISENTVKNHLRNIMEKLNIYNRVQAATYALENGLFSH